MSPKSYPDASAAKGVARKIEKDHLDSVMHGILTSFYATEQL